MKYICISEVAQPKLHESVIMNPSNSAISILDKAEGVTKIGFLYPGPDITGAITFLSNNNIVPILVNGVQFDFDANENIYKSDIPVNIFNNPFTLKVNGTSVVEQLPKVPQNNDINNYVHVFDNYIRYIYTQGALKGQYVQFMAMYTASVSENNTKVIFTGA